MRDEELYYSNTTMTAVFIYVKFTIFTYTQLAQYHNAICLGGSLHKNNTSCLLSGLYHASVNKLSIVLMQITPQDERYYGLCASSELAGLWIASASLGRPVHQDLITNIFYK